MNIEDFFDPYNMEHIKAYNCLLEKGYWPEGFISEDMLYSATWHAQLAFKTAKAWVNQVLAGNVVGMPPVEYIEQSG